MFAITHQSFIILAGCGVVLEFYFVFNGYKSVYLLDIRIGVIQGVVQMKN